MATTRGSLQVKDGKYYAVLSFKTDEIQANGKPKYKTVEEELVPSIR